MLFFRVSSCSISVPVSSLVLWVFTGDLYLFSKLFYSWSSCALLYFFGFSSDVVFTQKECDLFHTVFFLSLFWRLISTVVLLHGVGRGEGEGEGR